MLGPYLADIIEQCRYRVRQVLLHQCVFFMHILHFRSPISILEPNKLQAAKSYKISHSRQFYTSTHYVAWYRARMVQYLVLQA